MEEHTIRLTETAGLGVAISKTSKTHTPTVSCAKPNAPPLPHTSKPSTSAPTTDRYVKIELVKLNVKPGELITVSDNLLASIPVSKYTAPKTVSSKDTVDYWPLDEDAQCHLLQSLRPTKTPKIQKNVQRKTFSMSTHGIRK